MWHTMPGTCGSSKTLTHTLSFGESALNVVLTQPKSVARAELIDITTSAATKKSDFIRKSPLRHSLNSRAGYPFVCRTICKANILFLGNTSICPVTKGILTDCLREIVP